MPRSTQNAGSNGIRLNKYLAQAGVASRRYADVLIERGKVRVNGKTVREMGTLVEPGDKVDVSGTPVQPQTETVYLVLHKPAGVVTTMRDPQRRRTIAEMLPRGPRVVPVGRLDYETNGVLLLTNDGELAHRLTHPSFEVPRTYRVVVSRPPVSERAVRALRNGVQLEDGRTAPARVRRLGDRSEILELTIHEGRKRQVKRMCEAVGYRVRSLERVAFGPLVLGALAPGEHRRLSEAELEALSRAGTRA